MSRPPRRPPPTPRHTVTVEIAGEKHVLRSDVTPEYTRAVAAHVDATIRALPGFQTLEPFRAATLAALSITDELFRAREEIRRLREEAADRADAIAERLEAVEAAAAEGRRGARRSAPATFDRVEEPVGESSEGALDGGSVDRDSIDPSAVDPSSVDPDRVDRDSVDRDSGDGAGEGADR